MSEKLAVIARNISAHWKRAGLIALAVLVVLGVLASASPPAPPDNFNVPGTDSQKALDLFQEHDPALGGVSASVVFSSAKKLTGKEAVGITKSVRKINNIPGVISASNPVTSKPPTVSPDGHIALSNVLYKINLGDIKRSDLETLQAATEPAKEAGVDVSMGGQFVDAAVGQSPPIGELIGIGIAILLLTILFRSPWPMIATLLGALFGVAVGQLLLSLLDSPLGLPSFAATIAVMLGLGAGIDYSLLIISRYREQVAAGDSSRDAAAKAAATSGAAVVSAGVIVVVAIAGLLVIGIPLIGKIGIGAAIGVAAVVLSALTVLPILIGMLAKRMRPKKASDVSASPAFKKWGTIVTEKPWLSILGGVLVMLLFAFPALDMRLGQPDDGNQPKDSTERIAYDLTSEGFGAGFNGPFLIAVSLEDATSPSKTKKDLARLYYGLKKTEDVADVAPPTISKDKKLATYTLIPKTAPQDERTSNLLKTIRNDVVPKALENSPLKAYVGGVTAGFDDFSDKVSEKLPVFILLVIGMAVVLLMASFRSFWIPLVSALFNLLSVAAAYGVVVAVFQKGIGAGLLGIDPGVPIVSFIPVIMFAILFGLSMDYNVFLLSRVHESYNEGDSPRDSVINGVSRIGKIVLFAGLIMASVFLAFVTDPNVTSKMIGLGLGMAILIDVIFIRLIIAPAVVTLLGDKAWWLPKWLDKILPNIELEGHLVKNADPVEPMFPEEKTEKDS